MKLNDIIQTKFFVWNFDYGINKEIDVRNLYLDWKYFCHLVDLKGLEKRYKK